MVVAGVAGPTGGNWTTAIWVAFDDEANVTACLLAETDREIGRVWWWGPVIGVAVNERRSGLGRRLVSEALRRGAESGATHAHLGVRANNIAARRLHASLAFDEERVVVPYCRGFTLDQVGL